MSVDEIIGRLVSMVGKNLTFEDVQPIVDSLSLLIGTDDWTPCIEGLPKSNGKYLVTEQFSNVNVFPPKVDVLCFSTDLSKVNRYDFEKGESGFYRYDDEWGYTKVNDVTAWREKPEPYRVEGEE